MSEDFFIPCCGGDSKACRVNGPCRTQKTLDAAGDLIAAIHLITTLPVQGKERIALLSHVVELSDQMRLAGAEDERRRIRTILQPDLLYFIRQYGSDDLVRRVEIALGITIPTETEDDEYPQEMGLEGCVDLMLLNRVDLATRLDAIEHPIYRLLDQAHSLSCEEYGDQFEDILSNAMSAAYKRIVNTREGDPS